MCVDWDTVRNVAMLVVGLTLLFGNPIPFVRRIARR